MWNSKLKLWCPKDKQSGVNKCWLNVTIVIYCGTCGRTLSIEWRLHIRTANSRLPKTPRLFISSLERGSRGFWLGKKELFTVSKNISNVLPSLLERRWFQILRSPPSLLRRHHPLSQRPSQVAGVFLISLWERVVITYGMWDSYVIKIPLREFNQESSRGFRKSEEEVVLI